MRWVHRIISDQSLCVAEGFFYLRLLSFLFVWVSSHRSETILFYYDRETATSPPHKGSCLLERTLITIVKKFEFYSPIFVWLNWSNQKTGAMKATVPFALRNTNRFYDPKTAHHLSSNLILLSSTPSHTPAIAMSGHHRPVVSPNSPVPSSGSRTQGQCE